MPLLPRSVEAGLANQKPEIIGEEGVLYKIPLRNEVYFAKQWRGKHFVDAPVTYSVESGKTPVSPYWHKVKFYEGALVHQAFPESSIEMAASYDPRIKRSAPSGDWAFDKEGGRPVTVTLEVKGDKDVQALRDEIIRAGYARMYAAQEPDRKGVMRKKRMWVEEEMRTGSESAVGDTDDKVRKLLGDELHVGLYNPAHPKESLERLQLLAEKHHPNSLLIPFFEHGLVPVHPEFNFIPTRAPDASGPKGVFLEVAIIDHEVLLEKLLEKASSPEEKVLLKRKMNRYLLYRKLDEIYDELFFDRYNPRVKDPRLENADLHNAVFQLLEAIKRHAETLPAKNVGAFLSTMSDRLRKAFDDGYDVQETVEELAKVRSFFS